jgi:Spy/CpxP family protein refolding chaperone
VKTTKAILFSFLFLSLTATVAAQGGQERDPAERIARQTNRLTTVLDLTPEQAEKVLEINQTFAAQTRGKREALREEMEAANEARMAEMKAILSEEQFQKLEALHAQRKERRGDRQKGRNRGGRGR